MMDSEVNASAVFSVLPVIDAEMTNIAKVASGERVGERLPEERVY